MEHNIAAQQPKNGGDVRPPSRPSTKGSPKPASLKRTHSTRARRESDAHRVSESHRTSEDVSQSKQPKPRDESPRRHRRSRADTAVAADSPESAPRMVAETREERHLKREERQRARAEAEARKKPTGIRAAFKKIFA